MTNNPWTIIVAERGWIYVGRTHRDGDMVCIEDSYIVRRFSLETKDGLGGIASRGPLPNNDVLDAAPLGIDVYVFGVVSNFRCDQDAWSAWHSSQANTATTKT